MTRTARPRRATAALVTGILFLSGLGALPVAAAASVPAAATSAVVMSSRLGGDTRYDTSAAISAATFAPRSAVAYIASGEDFPDALSGSAVAAREGGPVLLTSPTAIPASIAAELRRLTPQRIVILGGPAAVSEEVASALKSFTAGQVTRLSGADRYSTAVAVSRAAFPQSAPVVFLASGENFPDALSSAAAAGTLGGPVLLTGRDTLPPEVAEELARLKPSRVYIAGGDGAVTPAVAASASAATARAAKRLAGADRYETSAAVAGLFAGDRASVFIASGTGFADALSGASAAVAGGAPLLLTQPTSLPASIAAALTRVNAASATVLGGTAAVSTGVAAVVSDAFTRRSAATGGTLSTGSELGAGACLAGMSGSTSLCVTKAGAVEVRAGSRVAWTSGSASANPRSLRLRADGDLALFSTDGSIIWRSVTVGSGASRLAVTAKGDVALSNGSGAIVWASMTGTDSPTWGLPFEPGQRWSAGGPHASSGSNETRHSLDFGVSGSSQASRRVVTIAAGSVFKLSCGSEYYLGVRHGGGWESAYYHLTNMQSQLIGKTVAAGTYLGDVGRETPCGGGATFDHVHLTIRYNGTPVSVEGMTFGGFTVRGTGPAFSGTYSNAAGEIVLRPNGGATCCLLAPAG